VTTLSAHGLDVTAPAGWDAAIYKRAGTDFVRQGLSAEQAALHAVDHQPIVHLCTRPLPVSRGDMGGGVVSELGPQDVFLVLFEYGPEAASQPLFAGSTTVPWPLRAEDFDAASLRTQLPGQVGCQRFFSVGGRSFMLYVVLGSGRAAGTLLPMVNAALASVQIG
jgi:hypothetical protein